MTSYKKDVEKLNTLDRKDYIEVYKELGDMMFSECYTPTVADFSNYASGKDKDTINHITEFTGNEDDIVQSIERKTDDYGEEESTSFMKKVIAANVDDITASGYFYKKLMSSCDNMKINLKHDCNSVGELVNVGDIDENTFNFKIKHHFITELDKYIEDYNDFKELTKDLKEIHVRTFLTCEDSKSHRTFCPKCAGMFLRSKDSRFTPKNIGLYSTLMITEFATQASLDSMNKGLSAPVNELVEQKLPNKYKSYDEVKNKINEIIDDIGYVGVQSRYYEVALLSRFYRKDDETYYTAPLSTSFLRQNDKLGHFIYKPNLQMFKKLLSCNSSSATSLKSRIMFDDYE